MSEVIFHLTTRSDWSGAQKSGTYTAGSLAADGFIHCSKAEQVERVANVYFPGQSGLVILTIDLRKLKADVRWEPGTDKPDELFPHVYGPINLEAVIQVIEFEPNPDGSFTLLPAVIQPPDPR
ncbi:MAG: DUF952 domain-containing protein [Anaerolineales bacterium]|nr:DUF952 domain-containing protein [Anaerolineales bacterium]